MTAANGRHAAIANGSTTGIVVIDVADFTKFTAERGCSSLMAERFRTSSPCGAAGIR